MIGLQFQPLCLWDLIITNHFAKTRNLIVTWIAFEPTFKCTVFEKHLKANGVPDI